MAGFVAAVLIGGAVGIALLTQSRRLAHYQALATPGPSSAPSGTLGIKRIAALVGVRLRRASQQAASRAAAVEVIAALAAELRAGQSARPALGRATDSVPRDVCPHAVGAARLGGDVPDALRRDSVTQQLPALRSLAALWQVGERSGAGLAEAADRLAAAEAAAESVRRELASQLAGPKATARVLAGLPILGLLLGSGLGASPIDWLVATPWGLLILIAGVCLEGAGIWWTSRMMRSVEALL